MGSPYIYRVIQECPVKENKKVKISNNLDAEDYPAWASSDIDKYMTRLRYEKDLQCSYQFNNNHEHEDMEMRMAIRISWTDKYPKFIFINPGGNPQRLTYEVHHWFGPKFTPPIFTWRDIEYIEHNGEFFLSIIVPKRMTFEIEDISEFTMYFEYYYEDQVTVEKSYVNVNRECAEIQLENRALFSHRNGQQNG
ncbi:Oidioi.mRNA.OKI2018_I69.PAR.g8694.t1.cds [Oikopleura dioica]|uniref:Oidioi.mRNA.OKI2018_I69.PAR.g8694.t1.cds n=1 Tax=Oikopleura dioica TaxID=34765 RepID=A0ABN7RH89_OIKDI|nr:Oidioi.mRNA.OKI2018_I69.PAR.g8694.t1.cds [Oikopleura dioica]